MKGDFTRSTWDRRKHYTAVRMQQGRVQIDADWNEQGEIQTHLRETALRDILGAGAVPESGGGFAVEVAPANGGSAADLLLSDGRLWLDGILCELGPGVEAAIEEFSQAAQIRIAEGEIEPGDLRDGDWIEIRSAGTGDGNRGQMARIAGLSTDGRVLDLDRDVADPGGSPWLRRWTSLASQRDLPPAPKGGGESPGEGTSLVYLDVWRWHVTSLEDPEIRETALGGPDTATRIRTVCQVRLLHLGTPEVDENGNVIEPFACGGGLPGWDDLTTPPSGHLRARTRPETDPDDPCLVPSGGGYVGLENQLYRVEVHAGGELTAGGGGDGASGPTFKWSRDNATVVTDWLGLDGDVLRVRSVGRDRTLSFHDARWVELTDDGRELRGEPGVLVRLLKVVDDEHIEVDPGGLTLALEDFPIHPKVRRWDMPDTADGALPIEVAADNDGYLRLESGIEVRFEPGTYRTGDYWWIPARAFVGERQGEIEWPRDAGGVPLARSPQGIEHHYLRLALVDHDGDGFVEGSETDCREPFCNLPDACRNGGCCTVTVGAHGDFQTIQEAIDSLPPEGGEVCVHPGSYSGPVEIAGRQSITIHGCGGLPRLTAAGDGPVVHVAGSRLVALRHLEIEAGSGVGVELEAQPNDPLEDILLEDLNLLARENSAVVGLGGQRITLLKSRVLYEPHAATEAGAASPQAAVVLGGSELTVEGNRITVASADSSAATAAGGIQICGGSERVTIRDNEIQGGHGNGITLGSIRFIPSDGNEDPAVIASIFRANSFERPPAVFSLAAETGSPTLAWNPEAANGGQVPISEGDLENVLILGNEISGMGANGIAVARFFDLSADAPAPELISVDRLLIEGNHIHECLQLGLGAFPETIRPTAAYGGITLAGGERIKVRNNVIENNGRDRLEPVCGVYLLYGVGVSFDGNRIAGNGRPVDPQVETLPGIRGGIVLGLAEAPTEALAPLGGDFTGLRQDGTPALRVHGNVVVSPEGRALEAVAVGPVSVLGNQLTAHGSHSLGQAKLPQAGAGSFTFSSRLNAAVKLPLASRAQTQDPVRAFLDTLGGAVVAVVNLGVSNELFLQIGGLSGTGLAGARAELAGSAGEDPLFVGGNVLFNDNQVVLDAFRPAITVAPTSVSLFSWDDVSVAGNQCDCDLVFDMVAVNTLVLGTSVRITDNRFEEGPLVLLSAFTWGWFNATKDNQGTHCFLAAGHPKLSNTQPNASLVNVIPQLGLGISCERWQAIAEQLSNGIGQLLP